MPTNPPDSACLSQADIERYSSGGMTSGEADRARRHLESCSACRLNVEVMAGDSEALFDRVREALPRQRAEDARQSLEAGQAGGDSPAGPAARNGASPAPTIEGYEIVRELHRGGQGIVYQAVQQSTKRKVAIKLLLDGAYASKSARKRFEREIELAANLKHPNIISIFHSGQTTDGHQYCVMDYIRGVSLDRHVRDHKLTLEDALKLFSKVCDAVNYAHQKGVIHRDLKPSNILVDADGTPKVLDFGLARQLINPEASLISVTGQVVGTLPYMSPEQARGNPDEIDTRTDIYALGVVLYEMLTGHYPYPVVGQMAEVLRHISETEPTLPSRSWEAGSGISRQTSRKLRHGACPIDDEVQTIVLRTLAKERERRYQSAGELAKDIGHYLVDEPIEAKRDSGWYMLKKHVRHYRLSIALAATFILVITGSLVVSISLWRQAERDRAAAALAEQEQSYARQEAEAARVETQERADELEIVTTFQQSMLSKIDAEEMGRALFVDLRDRARESLEADDVSSDDIKSAMGAFNQVLRRVNATDAALTLIDEQVLGRAAKAIERVFADQPLVRAALQYTVADTYREIGRYPPALPLHEAALQTRRNKLGDDHPDTLSSINSMGDLFYSMGKKVQAEHYWREALERRRRVLGDDHPDTLTSISNMGSLFLSMGKNDQAEHYWREALERRRRVLGNDHPDTLTSINEMGIFLQSVGKLGEAESYCREALDGRRRVLREDHPDTLGSLRQMGILLCSRGKLSEAEPYLRKALASSRRVLGDDHQDTQNLVSTLGTLLARAGKFEEASVYYREALEATRRVLGDNHWNTLVSIYNMGDLLREEGQLDEAEALGAEAIRRAKANLAPSHWFQPTALASYGRTLTKLQRFTEAEAKLLEAYKDFQESRGDDHKRTIDTARALADLYDTWHTADPEAGYKAKAAEWRARLPATSQPVSQPAKAAPDEHKDPS